MLFIAAAGQRGDLASGGDLADAAVVAISHIDVAVVINRHVNRAIKASSCTEVINVATLSILIIATAGQRGDCPIWSDLPDAVVVTVSHVEVVVFVSG